MKKRAVMIGAVMLSIYMLTACTGGKQTAVPEESKQPAKADIGFVAPGPDSYDSADTPVIADMDEQENTITFLNRDLGKKYTLSMDGTTKFTDKYGESISLKQVQRGDIVDITFLKSNKHLTSLQFSPDAWSYESVQNYEINTVKRDVTIGTEVFKLSDDTLFLSDGHPIEEMDINEADTLTFKGLDSEILSITVEKGHGYLRLVNDENFIGGWIEVGQSLIQHITEEMLLTVPEGSYQVNISYNGSGGTKDVVINRNEETTLDIGDLKIEAPKYGTILFSLNPSDARIYIDGEEVDASQPVSLEYGIHQLIAKASGYQSITRYLRVGAESAGIDVELDKVSEDSTESGSGSTGSASSNSSTSSSSNTGSSSGSTSSASSSSSSSSSSSTGSSSSAATGSSSTTGDTVTDYYKVYVDAPSGVEIYVDGNYVGISPCNFKKAAGSHVITLRKTGYETRSYTVQVEDEKKDVSYSFVDLVPSE